MKNTILSLVLIVCAYVLLSAQSTPISGVAKPSPNASSIPKFETGVNLFTGAATIGLPLMTVSADNVSLPMSLNYTSTQGVPVGMIASNVGLGWNLNAGGVITREVKHLPDDAYSIDFYGWEQISSVGYLYKRGKVDYLYNTDPIQYTDDEEEDLRDNRFDREPDVFHFSVGGYSGTFVFDRDGVPQLFSKQELKIEYENDSSLDLINDYGLSSTYLQNRTLGGIKSFTITVPDGTQYVFDKREISVVDDANEFEDYVSLDIVTECNFYGGGQPAFDIHYTGDFKNHYAQISSWYLTEVISPIGIEEIRIKYDKEVTIDHSVLLHSRWALEVCGTGYENKVNSLRTLSLGWRCDRIQFKKGGAYWNAGVIKFNYGADRTDLFNANIGQSPNLHPKVLSSIYWDFNGLPFQEVEFVTSYFQAPGNCSEAWAQTHLNRLRLDQVIISGNDLDDSDALPPYIFTYNSDFNLPSRHSAQRDWWGFYNASGDQYLYPHFYQYATDQANNNLYQTPYPIYRRPPQSFSGYEDIVPGYRTPHDGGEAIKANILTSIQYPNDYKETFDYEMNKAHFNGKGEFAGGLRLVSITPSLGAMRSYTYIDDEGNDSGRILSLPQFGDLGDRCTYDNYFGNLKVFSHSRNDLNADQLTVAYSKIKETISGYGSTETYFDIDAYLGIDQAGCDGQGNCAYSRSFYQTKNGTNAYYSSRGYASAPNPNFAWRQSLPSKVITKNAAGDLVSEVINTYKIFRWDKINGLVVHFSPSGTDLRAIGKYYYLSGDVRLESSTSKQYDITGHSIEKITQYEYNSSNHRFPTKVYFTNSDGQVHSSETTYISDEPISINVDAIRQAEINSCDNFLHFCTQACAGNSACIATCEADHDDCINNIENIIQNAIDALPERERTIYYLQNTCRGWWPSKTVSKIGSTITGGTRYTYSSDYVDCPECPLIKKTEVYELNGWYDQQEVISYNHFGRPTEIDDREINNTISTYNGLGLLETSEYGDFVTTYSYTPFNQLWKVANPDTNEEEFEYDGLGRVKKIKSRDGNIQTENIYTVGTFSTVETITTMGDGSTVPATKEWYDRLGRQKLQSIKDYTVNNNNWVTRTDYDDLGRVITSIDPTYIGETTLAHEASPVSRRTITTPPSWPRTVQSEFHVNNEDDAVIGYSSGKLFKQLSIDENENKVAVFTDLAGRKVLSRQYLGDEQNPHFLDTYYKYDNHGLLEEVKQPLGTKFSYEYDRNSTGREVKKTIPGTAAVTLQYDDRGLLLSETDVEHTISYQYDEYGRVTDEFVDSENISTTSYYGINDLPVKGSLGQVKSVDEKVLNDVQGTRLITTYWYDDYGRPKGSSMENLVGGQDIYSYTYDMRDILLQTAHTHNGYTDITVNMSTPHDHGGRQTGLSMTVGNEAKNVAIYEYDERDLMVMKKLDVEGQSGIEEIPYGYNSRAWIRSIGTKGNCPFPNTPDDQPDFPSQDNLTSGPSTIMSATIQLAFNPEALDTYDSEAPGEDHSIMLALSLVEEDVQNGSIYLSYRDTSFVQLGTSPLPSNPNYSFSQNFDVKYPNCTKLCENALEDLMPTILGVIGQQTNIQNDDVQGAVNNELKDILASLPDCEDCEEEGGLFWEVISYQQGHGGVEALPQYNGNVSMVDYGVRWRASDCTYGFQYDRVNRITKARYEEELNLQYPGNGPSKINKDMYNADFAYDDNGNMNVIKRRGYTHGQWPHGMKQDQIDDVTFSISNNLVSGGSDVAGSRGYKGGGYSYQNGKVFTDGHNGVTQVLYNHMDLPYFIETDRGTMEIVYDASGNTLRRIVKQNGQPDKTYDYAGSLEYQNQELIAAHHAEGRYLVQAERWEYVISDHLGNGRVWFSDYNNDRKISTKPSLMEVYQEQHYYPYGMKMEGDFLNVQQPEDRDRYNGIENVTELGLDIGLTSYRVHDPAIGRWWQVDPAAESLKHLSPYNAMNNNPMSMSDPQGDLPWAAIGIAAAIGGFSQGVSSANNGGTFLSGFAKGAIIGGGISAATFGVGSAFGAVGSVGSEIARATTHGILNGLDAQLSGGGFGSGFLSGMVSSSFSSAFDGANDITAYLGGGLSGGFSSLVGGGSFLSGFGTGVALTALNHKMHTGDPETYLADPNSIPDVYVRAKRIHPISSFISTMASGVGSTASGIGYNWVNGGRYKGPNGKYHSIRSQGWNQYTGTKSHMNTTLSSAKTMGRINRGMGLASGIMNTANYTNGHITSVQWGFEMTSTGIGTFAPPIVSIPWTVGYEGLGRYGLGRTRVYKRHIRPWVSRNIWGNKY